MPNGYGTIAFGDAEKRVDNGYKYTHRYAYELEHGSIPDGLFVLHRCDNRICVNPSHLFLGTAADNSHDATRKGRNVHKLTREKVTQIRELRAAGATYRALASQFGVAFSTIGYIVRGIRWPSSLHS